MFFSSDLLKRKEGRSSEHDKVKHITYDEHIMPEYLSSNEDNMSIEDKKWLFKCRDEDLDIRGNQRWKY